MPSFIAEVGFRRLRYVRYADDFLLGLIGTKEEALVIKEKVREFLADLGLTLSETKTLITHAKTERARFLGYEVRIAVSNTRRTNKRRSINGVPMLHVPQDVLRKWRTKYMKEGKTADRAELLAESDFDIVRTYAAEYNGVINYYEMAVNRAVFHDVKGHFSESLVRTLAAKHKTHIRAIYRKYQRQQEDGPNYFEVCLVRKDKPPLVARFGEISLKYHRIAEHLNDRKQEQYFSRNQQSERLLAEVCELCGRRGPLQGHHVRKLSDLARRYRGRKQPPAWVVRMVAIRRKTLFLCPTCHQEVHSGRWDGKKVE
jgi:hypothetical protein